MILKTNSFCEAKRTETRVEGADLTAAQSGAISPAKGGSHVGKAGVSLFWRRALQIKTTLSADKAPRANISRYHLCLATPHGAVLTDTNYVHTL